MKDKNIMIKSIELLTIILIYHIAGKNSLFLYALTYSLYKIFVSCFSHITIKEKLNDIKNEYDKLNILKYTAISILIICILFILLSILMSDTINILLNVKNTIITYLIMSLSIIAEPLVTLVLEYLESHNKPKLSTRLLNIYHILDNILLLIIGIISFVVFKFPTHIAISLLYLSKILSLIIICSITYFILKTKNIDIKTKPEKSINYKKEIKDILSKNSHKSIILLTRNSYYYISIIILYMILSSKYSYNMTTIENKITFIYFYAFAIINFLIDIILSSIKYQDKKTNIISYILTIFRCMLTISIVLAVTSPLICNIIFFDSSNSIYLMMLSFLTIFIALYNIVFENIKNKKIIYTSLIVGILTKILLIVPLIHSFYRMGYNLVYGDIISTIIGMFISIIINYIYLKNKNKKEKILDKILTILYESMLLCIILIILQFIIPIKTNNYILSLISLIIYTTISILFLKFQKEKRG